ncbi:MAG: phosphatidylinositol-specific phospholipase C domain-containing protein [Paracoccaceae bacterium]
MRFSILVFCVASLLGTASGSAQTIDGDAFTYFDERKKLGGPFSISQGPRKWLAAVAGEWMKGLPDDTPLAAISIPGTHDSAAYPDTSGCGTQTWNIDNQLRAGIRFLDIRLRRKDNKFQAAHGSCLSIKTPFSEIMETIQAFLAENPSEMLLMRVKSEGKTKNSPLSFPEIWNTYMQEYGHLFYPEISRDQLYPDPPVTPLDYTGSGYIPVLPVLGELRGKILIMSELGYVPSEYGLRYHDAAEIQDEYKVIRMAGDGVTPLGAVRMRDKKKLISAYLEIGGLAQYIVLNYLSGSTYLTPEDVAGTTNKYAYDSIGYLHGKRVSLGVVIADFPGNKLVYRIIKSNFDG